ncbi:hypothetical protein NLI96_g8837 [Meripilus lineatus]|uniref:Uncharacterized protein n=1 Tax=Meripilus lineatus TaxID=2056292 RepID=A0AAD5UY95_9APHY|nr:hypothetical protein NLI96_g8837 [Physisporinus lineatus]
MIPIPYPDARFYLPSAPPGRSSLPRTPSNLRKRPELDKVLSKQTKKGAVKKLLKKPRVFVGACKSVLAKVHKAKAKPIHAGSDVDAGTDAVGAVPAPDISADVGESDSECEGANEGQEVEIGYGHVDEVESEVDVVVDDLSSVKPLTIEVEGLAEEGAPAPADVPETPVIQPSVTEEDSIDCIACLLGIGHGIPDVESDVSQIEDPQGSTETETEVSAPVLCADADIVDEVSEKVNENVTVQNESPDSEDVQVVAEQAHDSSAVVKPPVVYANAATSTDDLSYVSLDLVPVSKTPSPSPSVPALLDASPVTTSVDAHNEVSTEVRAKTLTALINEAVARISDATGLPPSAIIQFAANLYSHEILVPSATQSAAPEAPSPSPAPTKVTAEVSIQTDDVPVSAEDEEEVDGCIISPMTADEREEEFELIDRVMRGARARKRAALDVGEQMIWFGIEDKILNEKYFLIIQTASIPDVFKLLPPKPIIPVFELEDLPDDPAPPPPPPPGPPPPPPPAALAPPPLVACGRKTLALPASSSDTPAPADGSAPSASSTPPPPNPAADRAAQEAAKAKARAELRAAIMQRQENGLGLRNAQDRVLRPAEPKSEVAPWQQEMLRRNGGDSSRTDNVAGPSRVQQESNTEPEGQLRFQLRATGRSLVDEPPQQSGSDDTPDNVAGPSEVQQESNAEPYVRPLFGLRPTGCSLVDEPNVQLNVQPRFQLRATGRSLVDGPEPAQQSGSDDTPDNVAGPSEVQQEPNAESYVRPLFGLRATGRSLVGESTQQTRSDDAPGMDISNLRANLRRTGRDIGNENGGALRRLRKGKGVSRPPLQSVNGPRDGSA